MGGSTTCRAKGWDPYVVPPRPRLSSFTQGYSVAPRLLRRLELCPLSTCVTTYSHPVTQWDHLSRGLAVLNLVGHGMGKVSPFLTPKSGVAAEPRVRVHRVGPSLPGRYEGTPLSTYVSNRSARAERIGAEQIGARVRSPQTQGNRGRTQGDKPQTQGDKPRKHSYRGTQVPGATASAKPPFNFGHPQVPAVALLDGSTSLLPTSSRLVGV